ncbi:MAG: tRNA (adenosine(37)-N6)-threonylcarbamoyltransferase complex dimerization subunit type 1 TsaB [Anaerolineae bacterium]|nr:tRNA (adenosine(37)-N6)-threonylcarbamoyltransferase complex dimerization subunit type 1 TsaB [Anaerolineae bacterium]
MLLAIDTATRYLSIALHDGQSLLAEHSFYSDQQHTVQLSPMISRLLAEGGFQPAELSVLALAQGPGSFSGLRVGFGVAKGLATALRIPLVGVPTLDILALATPRAKATLWAVAQAGRGRLYGAAIVGPRMPGG